MSAMSQRLQKMLTKTDLSGIYHLPPSEVKAMKQGAHATRFGWLQVDFSDIRDISIVLDKIGKDLRLPDWYGANFDALADCLSDLSWNTAPGYVLLIKGADPLITHDEESFNTFNEVLSAVIEGWQDEKVPFWVFYVFNDGHSNGLPELPNLTVDQ